MNTWHKILFGLLVATFVLNTPTVAAEAPVTEGYHVAWVGKLMKVHREGDASPQADLAKCAQKPMGFALGPLAGLRGEITVLDGAAYISRVVEGKVEIEQTWAHQAPFLVYGQVARWVQYKVPETVTDLAALASWTAETARTHGIDMTRPFPFKVETATARVSYHVISNTDGGYTITRPHRELMRFFEVKDIPVTLIGVYSTAHAGVFTHHGDATHIHMVSGDKKHAGHVDSADFAPGAILFLPKTGK